MSKKYVISEVLMNCLKVDYWDVDEMANQVTAVMQSDDLRDVLLSKAYAEYCRFTWNDAGRKINNLYSAHAGATG